MIYGDPFVFAIRFDIVEAWNDPINFWRNGLFAVFVDGKSLLDIVDVVELKTTVNFYAKMKFDGVVENDSTITAKELFQSAHGHFFEGESLSVENVHDMTCTFLGDHGLFIYFQRVKSADRLVWSCDFGATVYEKLLPLGVVGDVIESIIEL